MTPPAALTVNTGKLKLTVPSVGLGTETDSTSPNDNLGDTALGRRCLATLTTPATFGACVSACPLAATVKVGSGAVIVPSVLTISAGPNVRPSDTFGLRRSGRG